MLAGLDSEYHDNCARVGRFKTRDLYQETVVELNSIFKEYPNCTKRTGSLRLGFDDDNMMECFKQYQAIKKDGFPVNWYSGPEGEGFHIPIDGVFDPLLRARTMAERAMRFGAKLFGRARATEINEGIVRTEAGHIIRCKRTIVAVDGNIDKVLPEVAHKVRNVRLQMIGTEPAHDVRFTMPIHRDDDYWQQLADKRIILGGFDAIDDDEECWAALEVFLREHIKTKAKVTHRWVGVCAFNMEGDPICEEVRPGVFAIGAYSGQGNIIGTLYGKKAA